jgi:hypothetical protein
MNAFFARNRLSAYLDGELSSDDARAVEDALASDPDLRAELDLLRETAAVLRGADVRAPVGFAQRVSARVAVEPPPSAVRAWLRRAGGARALVTVAAAAMLALVGAVTLRAGSEDADGVLDDAAPLLTEDQAALDASNGADDPPPTEPDADPTDPDAPPAEDASGSADPDDPRPVPTDDASTARSLLSRTTGRASTELAPSGSGLPSGTTGKGKGASAGSARGAEQAGGVRPSAASSGRAEREAYVADWERGDAVTAVAVTATTVEYRVVSSTANGLKELAAVARSFGGELRDSRGDAMATYPMESGEARIVKLVVPAARLAGMGAALARVGEVQVVAETGAGLYAPDAKVPVRIEIVAP